MKLIRGKQVLDSLDELVDPRHTALLVVDMQNDFCSPGGAAAREDYDIQSVRRIIPQLRRLVGEARNRGALVVFAMNTVEPEGRSDSPASLYFRAIKGATGERRNPDYTVEGTWGHQIVPEIEARPQDLVIKKTRASAFVPTNLAPLLRARNIRSVIVTGVLTSDSIVTTAGDSLYYDFYTLVGGDCIADYSEDLHQAGFKVMDARYDVMSSEAILREWERFPQVVSAR